MGKMLDADLLCKGLQAEVRELCEQVAAGANKDGGLLELDATVRKLVLSLGDRVMARAVAQVAEVPTAPVPCPQCKRAMVFKQWRNMTIRCVTTGRPVDVRSPYMTCAECQVGRLVLPRGINITETARRRPGWPDPGAASRRHAGGDA